MSYDCHIVLFYIVIMFIGIFAAHAKPVTCCRMLSPVAETRHLLPNAVTCCRMLSPVAECCHLLLNAVTCCRMAEKCKEKCQAISLLHVSTSFHYLHFESCLQL